MDVGAAVGMVEHRWELTGAGAYAIVNGLTASIHLPEAEAVVHVSRVLPSSARVRALQEARARLADRGVPVVGLLPSMDGAFWKSWHDRYVEVESWLPHDGRMNTWESLRAGAVVLADVHNAWADLDLGAAGEECSWANWISARDAAARAPAAARLLTEWGLHDLARDVVLLSRLSGIDASLPRQVVHGDFWDNNVYLRGEKIIAVTDFDFLGRRSRVDDLALMLYFADEQRFFDTDSDTPIHRGPAERMADLAPLVRTYDSGLDRPLDEAELTALPYSLARQPLWTCITWAIDHPDHDRARSDALDTAPAVARALAVLDDPDAWSHAFAG